MLDKCLNAISPNVSQLNKSDKEVYYSEVKHLVKFIQFNKQQQLRERELRKQHRLQGFGMEVDGGFSEDSSSEEETKSPALVRKGADGIFHKAPSMVYKDRESYYPNLQVLKNLLTVDLIRNYPKLSLIAYEALHEYIEIFDNEFVSFFKQCQRHKLIERVHKNKQGALETQPSEEMQKRCKVSEQASLGRDEIIRFYMKRYRKNLLEQAKESSRVVEKQENKVAENAVSME